MNTSTKNPIVVGHPAGARRPMLPFITEVASVRSFVTHLGPAGRGLFLLLVLVLASFSSLAMLFPGKVTPVSASVDLFSGQRALAHLPVIAREPHPVGSPAQARLRDYLVQELENDGLEVDVQRTRGMENVVARLHGSDPTGAIVILTHYDTIPSTPGAGDNGAAVAALLEIMRALAAGPVPRNDVIALFDDKEEIGPFSGTEAFVREHPWMSDVRVAVSIDAATAGFISVNEVGPENNGWLVHVLARAYTGGAWMSMSGGGVYNSTPFREAGIPVLVLESNYPFRQYHTAEDLPGIISASTVQQMGEQTLSIARDLGSLDLANPWGEQETFFSVPVAGFIHYPQAWTLPLAIASGLLLLLALGLALWRKFASWRGLGLAFGTILLTAVLSVIGVGAIQPLLPGILGWNTSLWQDWPEVIPPYGGLVNGALALLVLALAVVAYLLARRGSSRADFSLMGLALFTLPALALAFAEPRAAASFIWPVLIGSVVWITALVVVQMQTNWSLDITIALAALPLCLFFVPFFPGIVMSDGMKSLNILAGIEVALLSAILPAVDGLLGRRPLQV
jgi:Peptidase family M28